MPTKRWLIVSLLFGMFIMTVCAESVYADSPSSLPQPPKDPIAVAFNIIGKGWELLEGIGTMVKMIGEASPHLLGLLVCLTLPLAIIGVWTLQHLPRILSWMSIQDTATTFLNLIEKNTS